MWQLQMQIGDKTNPDLASVDESPEDALGVRGRHVTIPLHRVVPFKRSLGHDRIVKYMRCAAREPAGKSPLRGVGDEQFRASRSLPIIACERREEEVVAMDDG